VFSTYLNSLSHLFRVASDLLPFCTSQIQKDVPGCVYSYRCSMNSLQGTYWTWERGLTLLGVALFFRYLGTLDPVEELNGMACWDPGVIIGLNSPDWCYLGLPPHPWAQEPHFSSGWVSQGSMVTPNPHSYHTLNRSLLLLSLLFFFQVWILCF